MATFINRLGLAFALLAICLQVVVCTVGGRFCFKAAPLTVDDRCPSVCCDEGTFAEAAVQSGSIGANLEIASPFLPSNSECCLKQGSEYMASSTAESRMFVDLLPSPLAVIDATHIGFEQHRVFQATASLAQPPPILAVLQTTILQL